jgi:hypothetical protein
MDRSREKGLMTLGSPPPARLPRRFVEHLRLELAPEHPRYTRGPDGLSCPSCGPLGPDRDERTEEDR